MTLNLHALSATPETLAALFGIYDPSSVRVHALGGSSVVDKVDMPMIEQSDDHDDPVAYWPLESDQHYQVSTTKTTGTEDDDSVVVPIKEIFALLPGTTEDEKSDRLRALSDNFYDRVWNDDAVPPDFHAKFHFVLSSARIQAFRQYDWLYEVFGGSSYAGEASREDHLVSKVMAKHTRGRMTLQHSLTWLRLMARSIDEVFPDRDDDGDDDDHDDIMKLRRSLGLYWLHFYGFFPYTEDERRQLRRVVFPPKSE